MKIINFFAQFAVTVNPDDIGYKGATDANVAVANLLNLVYTVAGMVAVIVIVIAGFLYITSRGNAEKTKQARNAIMGALIGIVVIMSAFVVTQFIIRGVSSGL